ncbi:MAG: protein kinase domain-containing protein [Chloroflexota bacterium]
MLEANTLLNDRYRILEQIGEGGMATVYSAVDTRLGRNVAIKVLHPEYARDHPFVERFQQEAEFAASLGAHPNIVDIYDIGQDQDLHYIVMELVEGRSLKQLMTERGPFPVEQAFALGQQIAGALDFAHHRGLVHRDVKPQNILVTPQNVAKVTDFGIARSAGASQMTRTGMVIGTVHYLSPEQAQGKSAEPPSDIYSLGVILYEMLTGHLPFEAENAVGVAMQHVHSEPPSPWEFNPTLPAAAVATVMRALEKDPERRYRDAGEFAAALSSLSAPAGATTVIGAVGPPVEPTIVQPPAGGGPPARRVPPPEDVGPPGHTLRNVALGGVALLLLAAIGVAAFSTAGNIFGGAASPTSTPRPHHKKHTPTPRPTKTPTAAPTQTPVVVAPVATSTPVPTVKATPKPEPTATRTPRPIRPTATPTFAPVATSTPVPHKRATVTIVPFRPTATPTGIG